MSMTSGSDDPSKQTVSPGLTDPRIAASIAELKLSLIESVDRRIEKQFDRDREFIQSTVGTAGRLLTSVVAVVGLVSAFFGVRTCNEIRDSAKVSAEASFSRWMKDNNSLADYQRRLDDLYDRSLIASLLIRLNEKEGGDVSLDVADEVRLLKSLTRTPVDAQRFTETLKVLEATMNDDSRGRILSEFAKVASASEPEYRELERFLDARREALQSLRKNRYPSGASLIRPLLAQETVDGDLRIAAIEYLAFVKDSASIQALASCAGTSDIKERSTALRAIAAIHRQNDRLQPIIAGFPDKPTRDQLIEGLSVAGELAGQRECSDSERAFFRRVMKSLATQTNDSIFLRYKPCDYGGADEDSPICELLVTDSFFSLATPIARVSHDTLMGPHVTPIWNDIFRDLARTSVEALRGALTRLGVGGSSRFFLNADLTKGGEIRIGSDAIVRNTIVRFRSLRMPGKPPALHALWDENDSEKEQLVVGFSNVEKMEFSFEERMIED